MYLNIIKKMTKKMGQKKKGEKGRKEKINLANLASCQDSFSMCAWSKTGKLNPKHFLCPGEGTTQGT